MKTETFAVVATGVGRADYTQGTELSVEPTIRSYQSVYNSWQTITVPALGNLVTDVAIPGGHVAILYDFFATIPLKALLGLRVFAVSGIVVSEVLNRYKYGSIDAHLSKGFPFFQTLRFTVYNYMATPLDVNIGAVGIYTDEEHYYLSTSPPSP